jgi:hypothetical protein
MFGKNKKNAEKRTRSTTASKARSAEAASEVNSCSGKAKRTTKNCSK